MIEKRKIDGWKKAKRNENIDKWLEKENGQLSEWKMEGRGFLERREMDGWKVGNTE